MKRYVIGFLGLFTAVLAAQGPNQAPAPPTPIPAVLQNYSPVTDARLKSPEPDNWLMVRRTYDGWGYSPLKQITTSNVARLRPVWSFSTGEQRGHEAPPIVNNGVMFVSTPFSQVIALDVRTGQALWRWRHQRPQGAIVLHETNRGVALYGDKVYVASGDAILACLDAKTGKEVWVTNVAPNNQGYYITLAPLVAGGGVMVGASGGELGIRGFVASFDLETGKERWRTYTIPEPGQPGSETWPKGDQWKTGGAPVWITGNYDQATNTAYWGTGNGGPWMGDQRPGDDLYTSSTLALDATTGAIKGHFQYTPNESFDWDEVSPPIVIDYKRNGQNVKGLIDVARNGYIYFLDRGNGGAIGFVDGKPYVLQTAFKGLDPKTGRPDIDPEHKPGTNKAAQFCPTISGGKNWPPVAFNPETRLLYIPANDNMCMSMEGQPAVYTAGRGYTGVRMLPPGQRPVEGKMTIGELQAWNVDTQQKVWTTPLGNTVNWGGVLTTAGGLVFNGGTADRMIHAFDAKTGKKLWEFPLNSGVIAPPSTFMLDGKQYLALNVGWGGDGMGIQAGLARQFPGQFNGDVPQGGAIWVFTLDGQGAPSTK